jgi:hypothetical protein
LLRRRTADTEHRHRLQLKAIEEVAEASLDAIEGTLGALASLPAREAYEECRKADYRVAFVRRLWGFFRERWDQRDDSELSGILAAADEVIWSCCQPALRQLERDDAPAPLAHVTPDFTAHAVGRGNPPPSLRESDRLLERTVTRLPVPLIGLPYSCVTSPWWLVLIAHEVGHQVAYAIDELEDGQRIADFVAAAARDAGAAPALERRWRAWSHEVFADAFAAATVGAGHLWALVELEQGSDETMIRDLPTYPPPIVRHELVVQLLEQLGLRFANALPPPPPRLALQDLTVSTDAEAWIAQLLEIAPAIAAALAESEVTRGLRLDQLTDWNARAFGKSAGWWRTQFRQGSAAPQAELRAARLATVGGLAAWAEIAEESDPAIRREQAATLRTQLLTVLPASREEGFRDEEAGEAFEIGSLADEVACEVLKLTVEDKPTPALVTG